MMKILADIILEVQKDNWMKHTIKINEEQMFIDLFLSYPNLLGGKLYIFGV